MLNKYHCYGVKLDAIKWWNPLPAACWCRQISRALINPTGHYASAGRRTVWSMALRDRFMAELWQWSDRWDRLRPDSCSHLPTPVHSTRHAFLNQAEGWTFNDIFRHYWWCCYIDDTSNCGGICHAIKFVILLNFASNPLECFLRNTAKALLVKLCPLMAREEEQ